MAAATIASDSEHPADELRRTLLAESDSLLEDVEGLRLQDETEAPPRLREAIRALQIRLGRRNPPLPPATLDAAHELVFAVQQRLMAANPKHPRPNRHVGRPGGQPLLTVVREERRWKLLTLPPPPAGAADDEWLALIDCMVERACDRWAYAQQHAVRAARDRFKPEVAVAVAGIAWANYWELLQEAERIKRRLLPAEGSRAALRS
ncbi:MAG TPA: hypothetical protein VEW68_09635 [Patescibacteria group bacterium]|nr:hypothetical protein [Patescibacteria group bacterium]